MKLLQGFIILGLCFFSMWSNASDKKLNLEIGQGSIEQGAMPGIPLFVVNDGQVSEDETTALVAAVEAGLSVSALDHQAVKRRLGFIGLIEPEHFKRAVSGLKEGQDLFFSGAYEAAKIPLQNCINSLVDKVSVTKETQALRRVLFEARLYMAMVAHALRQTTAVEEYLVSAGQDFGQIPPSKTAYPPWLCRQYEKLHRSGGGLTGTVTVNAQQVCDIVVDTKRYTGHGNRFTGLPTGFFLVKAVCEGRESVVMPMVISEQTPSYTPMFLDKLTIDFEVDHIFALKGEGFSSEQAVADVVSLGRLAGFGRIVVAVHRPGQIELRLVDVSKGRTIRGISSSLSDVPSAVVSLGQGAGSGGLKSEIEIATVHRQHWYKDVPAWLLVGGGLCIAGVGATMTAVYEQNSIQHPWAIGLLAAGAATTATGVVLFFVPPLASKNHPQRSQGYLTVSVGWTF